MFFNEAIFEARLALISDEVPVGAVIVFQNQIIARAHNRVRTHHDPTGHAEILALRQAAWHLQSTFLDNCDLYVSLEPCPMCATAIAFARIRCLYFGAYDPKSGGVEHGPHIFEHTHHKPEVIGGIQEALCGQILKDFFKTKRI